MHDIAIILGIVIAGFAVWFALQLAVWLLVLKIAPSSRAFLHYLLPVGFGLTVFVIAVDLLLSLFKGEFSLRSTIITAFISVAIFMISYAALRIAATLSNATNKT